MTTDLIARMEAMQQRFGTFPSLLQSAEDERRLERKAIGEYYDRVMPRSDNGELDYLSEEPEAE